jgi:hypothetical protein
MYCNFFLSKVTYNIKLDVLSKTNLIKVKSSRKNFYSSFSFVFTPSHMKRHFRTKEVDCEKGKNAYLKVENGFCFVLTA